MVTRYWAMVQDRAAACTAAACASVAPCSESSMHGLRTLSKNKTTATASFDCPCARCPAQHAGPGEGTAAYIIADNKLALNAAWILGCAELACRKDALRMRKLLRLSAILTACAKDPRRHWKQHSFILVYYAISSAQARRPIMAAYRATQSDIGLWHCDAGSGRRPPHSPGFHRVASRPVYRR